MGLLQYARVANYGRFYDNLKEISKRNGKPAWLMFADAGLCFALYRSGLQDYLNFRFYDKSLRERATYVTTGTEYYAFQVIANAKYDAFLDKSDFFRMMGKYARRDFCDPADGYEGFAAFVEKHPVFVVKPKLGLGGHGVRKEDASQIDDLRAFFDELVEEREYCEELIVQHPLWESLSGGSVNTLRVLTFVNEGKSRLVFACARIGSGQSLVDNFHQGGIGVLINPDRGCFMGNGLDKSLNEYETTSTGVRIDGLKIPYWEETKAMVLEAALMLPNAHLVGWDVAVGKDGPVLLEGNVGSGWDITQVVARRGQKDLMDEMVAEVKRSSERHAS